jgi:hypothetical protein
VNIQKKRQELYWQTIYSGVTFVKTIIFYLEQLNIEKLMYVKLKRHFHYGRQALFSFFGPCQEKAFGRTGAL